MAAKSPDALERKRTRRKERRLETAKPIPQRPNAQTINFRAPEVNMTKAELRAMLTEAVANTAKL